MKFTALIGLTLLSITATGNGVSAQSAKDIVGTWQHVANVNTAADGKKSDAFGPNPKRNGNLYVRWTLYDH